MQGNSRKKNYYFHFTDYAKGFDCVDHSKLWKILKETGIPDQLGREQDKAVGCHSGYLTYIQST